MNASSNPFSLIGPAGGSSPSAPMRVPGNLAQPSESAEATFVDSLSAVLATPFALPVTPVADQTAPGFGMLAAPLTDGAASNKGNLLLDGGTPDLISPTLSPGPGPTVAGDTSSLAPGQLAGPAPSSSGRLTAERLEGSGVGAGPDLAESLQSQVGSRATQLPLQPQSDEPNLVTTARHGERTIPSLMASPANTPSPLIGAHQSSSTTPGDGQTSTIAITAAARLRQSEPRAEPALPQQQKTLSHAINQPLAGEAGSGLVLRPGDFSKKMVNVDHQLSSDQGVKASVLHPSIVQQVQEQFTTSNVHLTAAKAGGQTANTPAINGTPVKPVNLANLPNVNAIEAEAIEGASRSSTSAEVFLTETGSLDPVGGVTSKPTAQPAHPPSAQIAIQIARAIPQGIDRFSIQLHPADLGMVEIRLDFAEEGRVSALIMAERPETLEMLQRDSRAIERTLNNAGLSLENDGLSFSLKQEQNQHGQGFNAPSHQQSQAFSGDFGRHGGGDDPVEQEPILASRQRLLDIRT